MRSLLKQLIQYVFPSSLSKRLSLPFSSVDRGQQHLLRTTVYLAQVQGIEFGVKFGWIGLNLTSNACW